MQSSGWIKVHRKMLDNPLICKDAEYLAVWMYLLLNATHTEHEALFQGRLITLHQGQLITGRKTISLCVKVTESKIQRILKTLDSEHLIEQQTGTKSRLITITNWNKYQDSEHQNEQQVNNNRTTSEQQVNTYKNVKKEKNVKNESITPKLLNPEHEAFVQNFCKYIQSEFGNMAPKFQGSYIENSCDVIEKLIRLDGFTFKQIQDSLRWAVKDDFWSNNVRSITTLRKKCNNDLSKFQNVWEAYSKENKEVNNQQYYDEIDRQYKEAISNI